MKLFILLSIGLIPSISFAQNIGSACGDQWNILPKCGLGLECVWENGAARAADWPGTCAAKEKPKELPTWFGTEDRVSEKRNWFSTLISSFTKPDTTPEKRVQICKKKDLSGRCIDRNDTYAVQMVTKGSVLYTAPQAPKLMPCITSNTKTAQDVSIENADACKALQGKEYGTTGQCYESDCDLSAAACKKDGQSEDTKPRTAAQCACPQPAPAGTPKGQEYSYCASDPNFKCNDTPS